MLDDLKIKLDELAAKKRRELEEALERADVHDPITATFVAWGLSTAWAAAATSALISVGVSVASYAIGRAFAPKPPKQTIGKLQGALQIQNSEQGIFIPEIYGRQIGGIGGIKIPAIIVWTSGIRKIVSVSQQPRRGGKGGGGGAGAGTVENISYDIDLGLMYCRGPVDLLREYANADILTDLIATSAFPTGVFDPAVGGDATYDPFVPPNPNTNYSTPITRYDGALTMSGGVGTGVTVHGAVAVYPGSTTQNPDPTIEAAIGVGSTPAYRNHSLIVRPNFSLSRWGGIVPNFTSVWQHQTLDFLDEIYGSLCERVNVKTANSDYDFSGISTIQSRGMLIAGRLFAPAEVIGSPEIQLAYNYFVTEVEGQIKGFIEGAEPSVTIADTQIGWLDGNDDVPDVLPEVDTVLASEIGLARQVDVKFIDPEEEWDPNTQSDNRQITEGVSTELLEVQLALTKAEARTTAQRKLYRDYVAGSVHKFTLPWTYLYLYPGYKVIITRAEGFTHTVKLTSISGGIGILNCEGVAIEPASFTQPAIPSIGPGYQPPQLIPAMTIVSLMDTPLLRDGDETENNGIGFYACGTARTGINQNWQGFALYISRNGTWNVLGSSNLPGTIGTVISATGLNTTDTSVIDRTGVITVDLYGTRATLSSVTEATLLTIANTNLALVGSMVIQFATATQVGGFPNRWQLTTLLNGRRGTESNVTDTFTGQRFVLIDGAVKFVPMEIADIDNNASYRAVTSGQSLGDAATVSFAWTGETLKPLSPVNVRGRRNADGDIFAEWTRRSRFAGGMIPRSDVPVGEELEAYDVEWLTTGNALKRTMRVIPGGAQAGMLVPFNSLSASTVTGNNIVAGVNGATVYTRQLLTNSGAWFEATLQLGINDLAYMDLRIPSEIYVDQQPSEYYSLVFSNNTASGASYFSVSRKLPNGTEGIVYTSPEYPGLKSARVRVMYVGSEIRFYWDYLGPGSIPVYASATAMALPVLPLFTLIGECKATNIFVGSNSNGPSTIYSALQQTADGFTPNVSAIKVRVYQISSIVGRGKYGEATL